MKRRCSCFASIVTYLAITAGALASGPAGFETESVVLASPCGAAPGGGTDYEYLNTQSDVPSSAPPGPHLPQAGRHQARIVNGCLRITGTAADSLLALRLKPGAPSILEIDVENNGTADFRFDRELFSSIVINAGRGIDEIEIDESHGVFTDTELTTINGGCGDDILIGGSGAEIFNGGPGFDTAFLGGGDDRFVWNPGDDTDLIEGGGGIDTVEVNGDEAGEDFTVTANGARVRFDRLDPEPFHLDIGTCENLMLCARGGDDWMACTGNLAALIQIGADGGPGSDTLLGSNGADVLLGGDGDDFIDGQQGTDLALLGPGNDTFQWDPGDGNDTIEGQDDHDTILFNGSNTNEIFDFSPNGSRLRFTRNVANIILDTAGVEQFDLRALGGADIVNARDLSGTDVLNIYVNFAGTLGGTTGDAQDDAVMLVGTSGADAFNVSADGGFTVVDLGAHYHVKGYEPTDEVVVQGVGGDVVNVNGSAVADTMTVAANGLEARVDATGFSAAVSVSGALTLVINALDGADMVSCVGNLAAIVPITIDGGPGDDTLLGSNGADVLIGGDGDDFLDGQQGNDLALMGAGNDTFQWDPGDGSDTIEGQDDLDVMLFNGSNASEIFDFASNGQRLRFTRNVGNVVMDVNGLEQFDLRTLGSTDTVIVNDLSGTDVSVVNVQLAGTLGGGSGDAQADNVIVNGTNGSDFVFVAGGITGTLVTGLSAVVNIMTAEAAIDRLTVNGLGGDDNLQATGLAAGFIGLTLSGGIGDDVLVGSGGADVLNGDDDDDTVNGGDNNDTIQLGAGNDRFIWNPGDDTDIVEGGADVDIVEVNGGNGDESFAITANGTRVRFDRLSPAPFALDIGTCESLLVNANGGNDSLACTGNLAALIQITADGGPGNDTLLGSNGIDVLIGGDDDDFIDGQQGNDIALMGAGDDTFQWDPGDGNDTVEGQDDYDTILFNGSNTGEILAFSANGPRLRFTRNVANIVMDVDGVEQFDLRALGSADNITVNDLSSTAVSDVNIILAGTLGGSAGDAHPDSITINGTPSPDAIDIDAIGGAIEVSGLAPYVRIFQSEPSNDTLTVNGLGGTDSISTGPGVGSLIMLFINQ